MWTLHVDLFITPHQVVKVFWLRLHSCFLQSSHLSMTFWSPEQFWWYDLEIFFPKCVHLIHTLLWDRKKSCNATLNLSLAFHKTSHVCIIQANQTRAGKVLFYPVAIYFSWSFHNTRIIFTCGHSAQDIDRFSVLPRHASQSIFLFVKRLFTSFAFKSQMSFGRPSLLTSQCHKPVFFFPLVPQRTPQMCNNYP